MKVIPDSSFFICFLDDLEGHLPFDNRIRILTTIVTQFTITVMPKVNEESRLHRCSQSILMHVHMAEMPSPERALDPAIELLRPLIGKGEHEVITCAHLHVLEGTRVFLFILDDGIARDLVKRTFPSLITHMKGTVGFIGHCTIYGIIERNEAIHLLTVLRKSKFRVDSKTIDSVIKDIQNR